MVDEKFDKNPANRDPITDEPGSHPVGTGVGSAGGAVAGAAAGAVVGGPIGAAVGGVVGAVAGGAAGHAAGEAVNPTEEAAFWRDNYNKRPSRDGQSVLRVRARLSIWLGERGASRVPGSEVP